MQPCCSDPNAKQNLTLESLLHLPIFNSIFIGQRRMKQHLKPSGVHLARGRGSLALFSRLPRYSPTGEGCWHVVIFWEHDSFDPAVVWNGISGSMPTVSWLVARSRGCFHCQVMLIPFIPYSWRRNEVSLSHSMPNLLLLWSNLPGNSASCHLCGFTGFPHLQQWNELIDPSGDLILALCKGTLWLRDWFRSTVTPMVVYWMGRPSFKTLGGLWTFRG